MKNSIAHTLALARGSPRFLYEDVTSTAAIGPNTGGNLAFGWAVDRAWAFKFLSLRAQT